MQCLLTHLIKMETQERADEAHMQFKSQVFAANPEMYTRLFAEEETIKDDDVEWIIPETEEEFLKMIEELDD